MTVTEPLPVEHRELPPRMGRIGGTDWMIAACGCWSKDVSDLRVDRLDALFHGPNACRPGRDDPRGDVLPR